MIAGAEQHIRRLDVAMDQAAGMRGVQRAADLVDDPRRPRRLERSGGTDQMAQVLAVDEPHRDVERPLVLARVVDRQHVRVVDCRRRARLGDEAPAEALVLCQVRCDDLQRDRPVEVDLDRAVDNAHAAAAGHALDAVAREDVAWFEVRHPCKGIRACG